MSQHIFTVISFFFPKLYLPQGEEEGLQLEENILNILTLNKSYPLQMATTFALWYA